MAKLAKQDTEKIKAFRKLFPRAIKIEVIPCEEGGYTAKIHTFPGAITQGDTWSELVFMVNDAVQCVLEVPEKYAPFMPNYSPSPQLEKKLNKFPLPRLNGAVVFSLEGMVQPA